MISFFFPGLVGSERRAAGSCRAGPAFRGSQAGVSERARLGGRWGDCERGRATGATAWSGRESGCVGKIEKSITQAEGERVRRADGGRGEERAKQKEMKSFKKLRAAEHF